MESITQDAGMSGTDREQKPYRRYRRTRYEATPIAQLSLEERRKYFREAKAAQRARKKGMPVCT